MKVGYVKYMRILLFFDLPSQEKEETKQYREFHTQLIKNGYVMMQYSIYVKCVNATTKIKDELNKLKKKIPTEGNIRMLWITEKQYQSMLVILGNKNINEIYNNSERYIKI